MPLSGTRLILGDFSAASQALLPAAGATGTIEIQAGQAEATLNLTVVSADGIEGLQHASLSIVATDDYATVRSSPPATDEDEKKDGLNAASWVKLQVLDDVALFVDGTPGSAADPGGVVDRNDVRQGGVGNCYFHAALLQLALKHPTFVQTGITRVGGTPPGVFIYRVRFFDANVDVFYEEITLSLDRGFDQVYLSGDWDGATGAVEIWTVVMEQAYAQYRGGYGNIDNGGNSADVWRLLIGQPAAEVDVSSQSDAQIAARIETELAAGKKVIISTETNAPDIPGHHALAVISAVGSPATAFNLYNPWGENYDGTISVGNLSENVTKLYIMD